MKQVLQNRAGLTVVRSLPSPACSPGGLLVRNAFSAISSGTERARIEPGQRSLISRARERPDLVKQAVEMAMRDGIRSTREAVRHKLAEEAAAGYSCAGIVIEVGSKVREFRPGDTVACAGAGHANHAEVVSVPANLCARVPDGVPLPAASLTTIAAIALHSIRVSDVRVGDRVAVIGCGLVGQIACRLARSAGARVYALDIDPDRVDFATVSGADHGIPVAQDTAKRVALLTSGVGVDHAIVTAAARSNDPLLLGAEVLRDRGHLTLVGDVPIEIPRGPMYMKELVFRISRSYGPGRYDLEYEERGLDYPVGYVRWTEQRNMEAVLALQERGLLRLDDLVESIVMVDQAAEAYSRLGGQGDQRPRGAIVLQYDGPDGNIDNGHITSQNGHASDSSTAQVAPKPASRPPSVGFIGCGDFASRVLVPAFRSAGAHLEVVGGGSGPSADNAVRRHGFRRAADSEEAVITDQAIDAVVITTRHSSHARLAASALERGQNVFCEKPLALSVDDLHSVMSAARSSSGILAVGFNRRFSPMLSDLREFVRGDVVESPLTATYRVSAGYVPEDHWLRDLEQGGGRVIGEICHFLDVLSFLTGSPIVEVYASGHDAVPSRLQACDNTVLTVRHADGSTGSIAYVAQSVPTIHKERLEVFGPGGIALLDDYRSLELHSASGKERRVERRQDKGHQQEVMAFLEGVRAGEPPVALDTVENVSLAALAAVESLRFGLPVRLDVHTDVGAPR